MKDNFTEAIIKYQSFFNLKLKDEAIRTLSKYKDLVFQNNPLLHLTASMSEEEFAVRHVLESLFALEFLPPEVKIADVGAGAGLPSIPCLIVRSDLKASLIESRKKKADFLKRTTAMLKLDERAEVINQDFERVENLDADFVCCRALDKFTKKLSKLLKWQPKCFFVLFGSENLRQAIERQGISFKERKIPLSERRFVFFIEPNF